MANKLYHVIDFVSFLAILGLLYSS